MEKIYYTNGTNEVRIPKSSAPPNGYVKGRLKSPITTLGKHFYNNGKNEIFIGENDTIPSGYVKGRLKRTDAQIQKHREAFLNSNYHWYNNGETEISVSEKDTPPPNFKKGRLPTPNTARNKMSKAHKGKKYINNGIDTMFIENGENLPQGFVFGKLLSEDSHKNLSLSSIKRWANFDEETRRNISIAVVTKGNLTKELNGSFNTSSEEDLLYRKLCEQYSEGNVIRQYSDKRYPFKCDFYIPSEDLFIELNKHWTHGGRPFDPNDAECQKQLAVWQEKAKTSRYYKAAINTWTVRDVQKINCAINNRLNYIKLY